jgi:hypothetical protein
MEDLAAVIQRYGYDQHSLVTWDQLRSAGATKEWIEQQCRAGRLIREAPRTYRPWGVRRSWEMRATAAILSARGPAVVSHRSAAYLWGISERMPGIIEITVPRHLRPRARIGLQVHESSAFDLAAPAIRDLIPVTGVARTLLDCCAVVDDPQEHLFLLDEARRKKLVEWDELWSCLLLHDVRGRRSVPPFRRLLLERDGETPPGSAFARRMADLLEGAGLERPVFEHPVLDGRYHLDLAWPERMVAVECHGKDHAGPRALERDPERLNAIRLAGWFVLEYRWHRFIRQPQAVVDEVRQSLCG